MSNRLAATSKSLTPRQEQVYRYISNYAREHQRPPTIREIMRALGLRYTNGVKWHLGALERKGLLRVDEGTARGIRLTATATTPHIRMLGAVNADGSVRWHAEDRWVPTGMEVSRG